VRPDPRATDPESDASGVAKSSRYKIKVAVPRSPIPKIIPLALARLHAPFDHPDWIFEPKFDTIV
jgi:hypothetical protein